jgi:hypothetical protein
LFIKSGFEGMIWSYCWNGLEGVTIGVGDQDYGFSRKPRAIKRRKNI